MLTDEQENIIGDALKPLFEYLEHCVIVDVANRIRQTMSYCLTAEMEAQRLQQLGFSPARIRREAMKILRATPEYRKAVAKNTLEYKKTIKKLLREIKREAQRNAEAVIKDTADLSYLDDLHTWKEVGKTLEDHSYLEQLVKAMQEQMHENIQNLTQTTGFKTLSGYEALENLYQRELDKAMIRVCTGTYSREQVVYETVHSLAASGLRTIDFSTGYSMQLDTAVKLAVRTGAGQLSAKIMDANIQQTGENLVYVSKHWGARNTGEGHANHEQWQGKVYYIRDGEDYSEEAERIGQDRIMSLWYATGYSADGTRENDPLGLHGYNCRHKHYVWFLGSSVLPDEDKEPDPVTINGKEYDYYAITQKMRAMERSIRALKREREALAKLGMDTKPISVKIKQKIKAYQDFCAQCNIKPDINRFRYECGTADLTKTNAWKEMKAKMDSAAMSSSGGELNGKTLGASGSIGDGAEPVCIGQIDISEKEEAVKYYGDQIRNSEKEKVYVIDKDGNVYYNEGTEDAVSVGTLDLSECIVLHNHPASNGIVSFGTDDFMLMRDFQTASYRLVNAEYNYRVDIIKSIDNITANQLFMGAAHMAESVDIEEIEMQHLSMEYLKKEGYINYVREKIDREAAAND